MLSPNPESTYRTNAEKRQAVLDAFKRLGLSGGPSDRTIAAELGVSNFLVSAIRRELKGQATPTTSQKQQSELQQLRAELEAVKGENQRLRDENRGLNLEVKRLLAELRTPQPQPQPSAPKAPPEWRIELADEKIRIISPKNQQVRLTVRSLPGWEWETGDDAPKGWYLPISVAEQAIVKLKNFDFEIDPAIAEAIEEYKRNPPPPPPPSHRIELAGKELRLIYPYEDKGQVDPLLKDGEHRWEDGSKLPRGRYVSLDNAEQLIEQLKQFEFAVGDGVEEAIAIHTAQQQRLAAEARQKAEEAASVAAETTIRLVVAAQLDEPLSNGWKLFEHQKRGVEWLLAHRLEALYRGGILADHMGLGKTTTALVAARAMKAVFNCHIFIICPASLQDNWLREAERVEVEIEVFSWAKLPKPLESSQYIAIADEAHYCQNLKSQRTKAFLELAHSQNCLAAWMLTGTPLKNGRPFNLFPLLLACKHPLAEHQRNYEIHYCNAHYESVTKKTTIWDTSGAAHLDELARKTEDVILRRTKQECLDLPPKLRQFKPAEISSAGELLYKSKLDELRKDYRERLKAKLITNEAYVMVTMSQLRLAGSIAKAEAAITMAEELLEQGESCVIFTEFLESAKAIHNGLGGELLTGETPVEERQAIVDRFQSGESKVFIGTIKAGGVGLTLTAASHVILVDRPWTPGDAEQAEDRCHRIGQNSTVYPIWLQYREIDTLIDALLEKKQKQIELVLRGKRKTLQGLDKPSDLAKELLEIMFA